MGVPVPGLTGFAITSHRPNNLAKLISSAKPYRDRVTNLHSALARDDGGPAALETVRALIERVDVSLPEDNDPGSPPKIILTGAIAAMVELALEPGSRTTKAALGSAAGSDLS